MERRVKERLIGATILVVIIVGAVPEFLSGPKRLAVAPPLTAPGRALVSEGVRNVTVDLLTRKATAAPESTADAADGEGDDGSGSAPSAAPRAATQAPATGAAAAPPTTAAAPAVAPAAASAIENPIPPSRSLEAAEPSHRAWSVQLGSFASKTNADTLMHQLKVQGLPVYVLSSSERSGARFKVRVGPLPDRGAAERSLAKLKAQGHAGSLIAPNS